MKIIIFKKYLIPLVVCSAFAVILGILRLSGIYNVSDNLLGVSYCLFAVSMAYMGFKAGHECISKGDHRSALVGMFGVGAVCMLFIRAAIDLFYSIPY